MQIERVRAEAFGGLANEQLEFGPGLNIVYGPNEAGKSTWHAALYAALCGIRRGQGPGTVQDRMFRDKHQPWEGDNWSVGAVIALADGRRIELAQDLTRRTGSAHDADLAREYTNEIINDGSPDASRWLGLDRRSFVSTVCVRQAAIGSVVDDADSLQQHLQRAAATAGTDETAAKAINVIDGFKRETIGTTARNSRKPLRDAMDTEVVARAQLDDAQHQHLRYIERVQTVEKMEAAADEAKRNVLSLEAAVAKHEMAAAQTTLRRAEELATNVPEEPRGMAGSDEFAQKAAVALQAWKERPVPIVLDGESSGQIEEKIRALPTAPTGDMEIHSSVRESFDVYRLAQRGFSEHESKRPKAIDPPSTGGLSEEALRDLARDLEMTVPELDPALENQLAAAQGRLADGGRRRAWPVVGGALLMVAGIGLWFALPAAGIASLAVGIGLIIFGLARSGAGQKVAALEEMRSLEERLGQEKFQREEAQRRISDARTKASAAGVPVDPAALRTIVDNVRLAEQVVHDSRAWEHNLDRLKDEAVRADDILRQALAARGCEPTGDGDSSYQEYESACRQRAEQGRAASSKPGLEQALENRRKAEVASVDAADKLRQATDGLRTVGGDINVRAKSEDELADAIQRWLDERKNKVKADEQSVKDWQELQSLLDGRTVDDLRTNVKDKQGQFALHTAGLNPTEIAAMDTAKGSADQLKTARRAESEASNEAAKARGELNQFVKDLGSVPAAEEALTVAEAEHKRLTRLDRVLASTIEFMKQAQDKTNRSIAPKLNATLNEWLPKITGGRYSEARVDPESLAVSVRANGGRWREAQLVSHGTTEQVYLLLRVAMAEHLTKAGEVAPLILDDVTVQSDVVRQVAILRMLKDLSANRQIIFFSQEEDVRDWAEANLDSDRDRLIHLDASLIAP